MVLIIRLSEGFLHYQYPYKLCSLCEILLNSHRYYDAYNHINSYSMKILHTADWHLGQVFYDFDRHDEHVHFLSWLVDYISNKDIDVLLIAGDIYDGPNPSAEAQRLFYSFVKEVTYRNSGLQIIIIAGNHDSASRLEAPNPLLEQMNVTVRGVVRKNIEGEIDFDNLIVPIYSDNELAAYCLAVPYLRQGDYPRSDSYSEGVKELYHQLYDRVKDKGLPVIAMGHLQATGSELSDTDRSERTIIGGVEGVSPDAFDMGIAYTALGHLHRSQRVSSRENVRYSGAPLPMTFAEKNNKHRVVQVNLENGNVDIENIDIPLYTSVISIPAKPSTIDVVLSEIEKLPVGIADGHSPYLEIKILIDSPDTSYKFRIDEALQDKNVRLAKISPFYPQRGESTIGVLSFEQLQEIEPMDVAKDYYRRKFGENEMPDMMQGFLRDVIAEVKP